MFGFTDPRGYVRAFKKIHNTSPTDYRKNHNHPSRNNDISFTQFETNKSLDKLLKNSTQSYQSPTKKHKNSLIQDYKADFDISSSNISKSVNLYFSFGYYF